MEDARLLPLLVLLALACFVMANNETLPLASVAQGFVSAVLGLFGKGPKPKPLGQVVREQIDEALEQYREKELVRRKDGLLSAFQLTKAYLDGASESGKPLSTEEVPVATNEMERSQGVAFMGELASEVRKMFSNNKVADARKAIRYCEMYAQLAVYRDIILTQYIAMIPTTATWQNHINGVISDRALFRRLAGALLGKLYAVDYDSAIIPYFDPDISVITDTFSTKILNLGKYDRSMAGLHCLMTPGRSGLEYLDWERDDAKFKTGGNPYTTIVRPNNNICYWKLVPHAGHTYSIVNKYKCNTKYDYCGSMLSWTTVGDKAYVDIASDDPVLWEIRGYDWKDIRSKWGCGKKKSKWCNYHLGVKKRTISTTFVGFQLHSFKRTSNKIVGQLTRSDGKYYWKTRR
ncbi:uncharacterized protein LOC110252195, partial [Exaiptasia diaphana]|uniref:Uncharacterized protein n=1 Tax=Exaiptasia diaphana TaxID=2652724 RepID=A0A913YWS6_EXADI